MVEEMRYSYERDSTGSGLGRAFAFVVQTRMHRDSRGTIRSTLDYAAYERWTEFLGPFDEVMVIGRVSPEILDSGYKVEGPRVRVEEVPYYRGLVNLIRILPRLRAHLRVAVSDPTITFGGRVPDVLSSMVQSRAQAIGAGFVAQVVGDPEDVLRSGVAGRIGKLLATPGRVIVARQVRRANAVIYVTTKTLQAKYPAGDTVPTLVRSNVNLPSTSIAEAPRNYLAVPPSTPLRLLAVGSQEQTYKGHDVLIDAVGILRSRGCDVHATIIGDGRFHADLVQQVERRGLGKSVHMPGRLVGQRVRDAMADADIVVMPSRTEGLPRVLLEAMSIGTISTGSRVGGIPELLDEGCLFEADSADAIADCIEKLVDQPSEMNRHVQAQWLRAVEVAQTKAGPEVLRAFLSQFVETARYK